MCPSEPLEGQGRDAAPVEAWVFLRPRAVPERWRDRAEDVRLIPLLPQEAADLLAGGPTAPAIEPEEERLLRLVARGLPAKEIALELGMTSRSVERHIARLRERFGAASTAELAVLLARRGF